MFTFAIIGTAVLAASAVGVNRAVRSDGYGISSDGPTTWPTQPTTALPWHGYVR